MRRRAFIKLVSAIILVPSLPKAKVPELPVKFRYKGWDIRINERSDKCYCRQVFAKKGNHYYAVLFDREDTLPQIEEKFKMFLESAIKRAG